jgi:hypothetical protein
MAMSAAPSLFGIFSVRSAADEEVVLSPAARLAFGANEALRRETRAFPVPLEPIYSIAHVLRCSPQPCALDHPQSLQAHMPVLTDDQMIMDHDF